MPDSSHSSFQCVFWTHHEGIFHSDNGTIQDGRGHRGDLEQLAFPALALPLRQRVSSQIRHQLLDLLALALGKEGLGLVQGRLGHHDSGRAVLHLSEDLYRLTLEKKGTEISLSDWQKSEMSKNVQTEIKCWSSGRQAWLTWRVALSLDLGAEGDRSWSTEPAAQSFLLSTSLRGLFTHRNLL